MSQNSGVIRSGKCDVMRLPILMISMWGISRSFCRMYSMRRSDSIIGSPPERMMSRISVCSRMYANAESYWLSGIFSGSPTFLRRVQKRQYDAHTGLTRNRTRSGSRCVMFGTGESPSSSSESTTPSTISSSRTVGTYWFHIGSPTSLICSSAAGVMRTWNASNAGRSASTSITSWPNFSASLSSVSTLPSRRTFCHSLMASLLAGANRQHLRENHPIIIYCIKPAHAPALHVSTSLVEVARRRVRLPRRRLGHEQARAAAAQQLFHRAHQRAPVASALRARVHRDPVEIVARLGARRKPPARVALQAARLVEHAHQLVRLRTPHSVVEQLESDIDL